uniref:Chromosome 6 open reading frame, human C9orf24 n=1 Tax=Monodelphis domestica TaxID=13616 RepID=A0A5F8H0L9_MONDO
MFLFAHKTKTPISTYTDSYRAPASIKQDYKDPPLWAWEENKFVSPGLKKPMLEQHVDQQSLEKMVKRAVEEYSYKGSVPGNPYLPQKYWISEAEAERYNPAFISGDRYGAWRTGPYNSSGWNKYTTYLPRLPKEAGMETMMRGMPLDYPPKPDRFNNYEREVVVNMLNSLSRNQLPSIQPRYTVPGRLPFQGYDSPCTGRHYCLRGMDYYATGAPSNERHLTQPTVRFVGILWPYSPVTITWGEHLGWPQLEEKGGGEQIWHYIEGTGIHEMGLLEGSRAEKRNSDFPHLPTMSLFCSKLAQTTLVSFGRPSFACPNSRASQFLVPPLEILEGEDMAKKNPSLAIFLPPSQLFPPL